jgi:hypothetical protein
MNRLVAFALCVSAVAACRKREVVPTPQPAPDAAVAKKVVGSDVTALAETVVALFRRTIQSSRVAEDASSPALVAGKLAHEQLQEALTKLAGQVVASPDTLDLLLGYLSRPGVNEIDQLAFRELLLDLPANPDIDRHLLKLDRTIGRLEAELPLSLVGGATRGLAARPQWEAYETALAK